MTVSEATAPLDQDKLEELVGQFVVDLGAALHAVGVVVGDRLGLYRALAEGGVATADELAVRASLSEGMVARAGRRRLRHLRSTDRAVPAQS